MKIMRILLVVIRWSENWIIDSIKLVVVIGDLTFSTGKQLSFKFMTLCHHSLINLRLKWFIHFIFTAEQSTTFFFSRSHLPIDFLEDLILRKYCFWRGFKAFQVSRWYRSLGQEEAMTNSTRVVSINCGNIVVQSSDAVHTVRLSGLFETDLLQIRFWTYRKSARIDCKIENWALLNRSDCNTGFQKIILSSRLRLKSHNNQFLDVWADSS